VGALWGMAVVALSRGASQTSTDSGNEAAGPAARRVGRIYRPPGPGLLIFSKDRGDRRRD